MISVFAVVAAALAVRGLWALRAVWPRRRLLCLATVPILLLGLAMAMAPELYLLRKLFGALIMPAGLLWTTWFVIIWIQAERGRRTAAAIAFGLWLLFTISGNVWLGDALLNLLEAPFHDIDPMMTEPLDAVLVLGGGVSYHRPSDTVTVGCSGARAVLAARLYHAGKVPILVASGPVRQLDDWTLDYPQRTAELWQQLSVSEDAIELVRGPRTTSEEITTLAPYAARHGWQRIGLITSAYHLRRALRLCQRHGLEAVPLPAHFAGGQLRLEPRYLVPQAEGFEAVETACWELVGAALGQ